MKLGKRAPPLVLGVLWQHSQPCRAVCAVPTAAMASAGAAADGLHADESVRDVSAETHVSDAEAEAEATFARASQALQAVVADQQARIQQLERALAARAASEVFSIDPQVRWRRAGLAGQGLTPGCSQADADADLHMQVDSLTQQLAATQCIARIERARAVRT